MKEFLECHLDTIKFVLNCPYDSDNVDMYVQLRDLRKKKGGKMTSFLKLALIISISMYVLIIIFFTNQTEKRWP